jgi:alkylation response protein AidB-like acyl-CoA dehydrogenase
MIQDSVSVSGAILPFYDDEYLREDYFNPLMNAEKHMAFALTEPDHGSDPTWMDTKAEKDGDEWVINGTKCFISRSPYADCIMVHARTSGEDGDAKGISTFIVDRENPNWTVGKIQRPMGTEVGSQAFNHFNDCRVPAKKMIGEEGAGFIETAMNWVGGGRLAIPAKAVGRSQWIFDQCVDYAKNRKTFGKPISKRQFVQGMIAEMRVDIEQARLLYRHAARKHDNDDSDARWLQSAAKLRGSEVWNSVADKAIQIHGGAGYMRSLPFEGEYRNARASRLYEGTDEIQKKTISKEFLVD